MPDQIDRLLQHNDHPVIERYLVAVHGYDGDLDTATRQQLLEPTLSLDIDLNIRLIDISTEWEDENGDIGPKPDTWKAELLLGFESTYRSLSLTTILADVDAYHKDPADWPTFDS